MSFVLYIMAKSVLRSLLVIILTSFLGFVMAFGQTDETFLKKQMIEEANKMGQSIKNRQYDEFVKYLYPPTVEFLGGEEKIAEAIMLGFEGSYDIDTIEYNSPGPLLTNNNMYQCVFKQTIVIRINQGTVSSHSAVIGFTKRSSDKWYFIDADGRRLEELRRKYPFLSKALILPEMPLPTFVPNDSSTD